MSDIAISVENLSKKFRIGTGNSPAYHRLSEALTGIPRMVWNSFRASLQPTASILPPQVSSFPPASDFWALKDVSFEVKQGDIVGIIGRNGAGKSTLLKILSRITEPTSGRFGVRGRVASLLEVGTGFHPELTGRENIYVSGITLGMTRSEIKKRFDEIVDFSGVEKFLDTPVKHYSSGMQVRLGFAVAAHLESEILIVDEVLAVGDWEFQKKCIGRMEAESRSGRTTIFVSHSMAAVRRLCNRVVLFSSGKVQTDSNAATAILAYLQSLQSSDVANESLNERLKRSNGDARICNLSVSSSSEIAGEEVCTVPCLSELGVSLECQTLKELEGGMGVFVGIKAIGSDNYACCRRFIAKESTILIGQRFQFTVTIPSIKVAPGEYHLYLWIGDMRFTQAYDVLDFRNSSKVLFNVAAAEGSVHGPTGIYQEQFLFSSVTL